MRYRPPAVALALTSLALAAAPATQPATKPPAVGDTPAEFSLDTLDGTTVKSADLLKAGPVVVLQLRGWVGYQCPICTKQVGEFIAKAKEFKAAGATVVLVYPGPADDLKKYADDFISGKGLPAEFKFVRDPDLTFVKSRGLRRDKTGETAYPSTFALDKAGKVTFAKVSHDHAHRATATQVLAVLKKYRTSGGRASASHGVASLTSPPLAASQVERAVSPSISETLVVPPG